MTLENHNPFSTYMNMNTLKANQRLNVEIFSVNMQAVTSKLWLPSNQLIQIMYVHLKSCVFIFMKRPRIIWVPHAKLGGLREKGRP